MGEAVAFGARAGEHDRTACRHQRQSLLHREDHNLDVDVEDAVEMVFLDTADWRGLRHAGIGVRRQRAGTKGTIDLSRHLSTL